LVTAVAVAVVSAFAVAALHSKKKLNKKISIKHQFLNYNS